MSTQAEAYAHDPLGKDCFNATTDVLDLCRRLRIPERSLIEQLRRSIVSIGSNMNEAHGAETLKFCSAKLAIAYRECRESRYQLALIAHVCPEEAGAIAVIDAKLDSIAARLYTGIRSLRVAANDQDTPSQSRYLRRGGTSRPDLAHSTPSDDPTTPAVPTPTPVANREP